ncbi:MAG: alpha/beta hydrolase [Anaerolineaceae bacterium]|nr:alpha/beta hydrolase [Anaerolineaceae bacterium]
MKKSTKIIILSVFAVILIGLISFTIWASDAAPAQNIALEQLSSTNEVNFEIVNNWLVFKPADKTATTGLILYPGARVDPKAYAFAGNQISAGGFLVVIVPMPLNMAIFGIDRAEEVIQTFSDIDIWAISGHSLGGAMAAEFAGQNLNEITGLVLWAAYPAESNDLTQSNLSVLSISASLDGLATPAKIDSSHALLPTTTHFAELIGGNHAGFGYYGSQSGDGQATISQDEQQAQIIELTTDFLRSLSDNEAAR